MNLGNVKKYILLYGAFLIYSVSTICAKYAARQNIIFRMLLFMGLEVAFLGIYAIVWQQVLKKFSLVTAMASKGIVVIFNMLLAFLLFGEAITLCNIIGAFIIIFGIWVVSSDG